MAQPVDLKAIREARLAQMKADLNKRLAKEVISPSKSSTSSSEDATEVTEVEIKTLLSEAENLDWENIGVFSMLAWCEQAVDIFQRMLGEPQSTVVGNARFKDAL